ncbi:MAG: hypothetical protein JEY96_07270 [Bacteroidales bacterium]|nr:hypothetical protein [Bacteroidales bacterium]
MSQSFIDRSLQQNSDNNQSETTQKKIDPKAQANWIKNMSVDSGWGMFNNKGQATQMFAKEEEEQGQAKGLPINNSPSLEKEADEMGAKVAQGKMVDVVGRGSGVQRQVLEQDPPLWSWGDGANFQTVEENEVGIGVLSVPNSYNVWANNDGTINVVFYDNEGVSSVNQVSGNIQIKRTWIVNNYNWNAIIGIMKYASENVMGFTYTNPNNITGITDDNSLIIPDAGILGIVKVQLQNAVSSNNGEITTENITTIMSSVDGLPGTSFATIMGEDSKNTLRDEGDNTNMKKADDTDIELPDFGSDSEETLYDFMRDITLARNGLWSDEDNIVNLTGLRRELEITEAEDHEVQWNDTMAASWIETDAEGNEIKYCRHYSATTEPGNRDSNRIMTPQTMTVLLGLHSSRQPGGRTEKLLIKGSDNNNNGYDFDKESWEAGLNLHPGGMDGYRGQINVTNSALAGFSGAYGATTEDQFSNNLLLGEAFYILSKYGTDRDKSAYDYLKTSRDSAIVVSEVDRTNEQNETIADYNRITTILGDSCFTPAWKTYLKETIEFNSEDEEEHLDGDAATAVDISTANLDDGSQEISENVHLASEGCQVVYGAQTFYDYWWNTINKAEDSGQRRWYYTLINITDPYNEIETQEGDLNE